MNCSQNFDFDGLWTLPYYYDFSGPAYGETFQVIVLIKFCAEINRLLFYNENSNEIATCLEEDVVR